VLINTIRTPSVTAFNALKLVEEWTKSDTSTLHTVDADEVLNVTRLVFPLLFCPYFHALGVVGT
jgi:hypothetical protein